MHNLADWNHLRAFHATASCGSLSAAARALGLTQPTLSRQVAALESQLGLALFDRVGQRLVPTRAGRALAAHVARMNQAAEDTALAARSGIPDIAGRVCISATDTMAAYLLPPLLGALRDAAPELVIEIRASNAHSNLHKLEADIAIRHAPPAQDSLIGRHVADCTAHFYAAKTWLAAHGLPTSPADLPAQSLLGFGDTAALARNLQTHGLHVDAKDFRLISESAITVWEMARAGLGVAAMLRPIARQAPDMVEILPMLAPIPVPIWLITHRAQQKTPRITFVMDHLAHSLAQAMTR